MEEDHPRDENGQFSAKGGEKGSGEMKSGSEKARETATKMAPQENWVREYQGKSLPENLYIAESRTLSKKNADVLEKEIRQAEILTKRGRTVYLLPENPSEKKQKHADAIVDGEITEIKGTKGNRNTIGWEFGKGNRQGRSLAKRFNEKRHSVFLFIETDIPLMSVKAKIRGCLKNRNDMGKVICYFEKTNNFVEWDYQELRDGKWK